MIYLPTLTAWISHLKNLPPLRLWSRCCMSMCHCSYLFYIHYRYTRVYLLRLHSSWPLALRGASRWAGNTRWSGSQCLVHLSQHHLWDELAVLCLVITNQLHRWTHDLDKDRQCIRKCVPFFLEKFTRLKCCLPRLDNKVRTDKLRRINCTVVNTSCVVIALLCAYCDFFSQRKNKIND